LNDTIKAICDRLASEGFTAYAPDLYHGQLAVTIEEAEVLSENLDQEQAKADVAGAMNFLSERAKGDRLAVIGFSLGAFFALDLSTQAPEVKAVVLFYGTGPGDFSQANAAYLGHFAEDDEYEPADWVNHLETALRDAGRPVTFHHYRGSGHWFFEADRLGAYNPSAAQLAWERTLYFLKGTLE
jgi:carboxymethylenebutenolidase